MARVIKAKKRPLGRVRQGDIFRNIEYIEYVAEESEVIEVSKISFPLVIVLTQDCDLEQDDYFRSPKRYPGRKPPTSQDKFLLSVLVAPLYNVEHVYVGEHLSQLGLSMEKVSHKGNSGTFLRNNERPRYHYLEFPSSIPIVPSVIDFKHYFAVNVKYLSALRRTNFVCSVSELYREAISLRFAHFLARIGLPDAQES